MNLQEGGGSSGRAPLWEEVEGLPCRIGALDGPLLLLEAVVRQAGATVRKGQAVKDALHAAVTLLSRVGSEDASGLQEVYPRGLMCILEVLSPPLPPLFPFFRPLLQPSHPCHASHANSSAASSTWHGSTTTFRLPRALVLHVNNRTLPSCPNSKDVLQIMRHACQDGPEGHRCLLADGVPRHLLRCPTLLLRPSLSMLSQCQRLSCTEASGGANCIHASRMLSSQSLCVSSLRQSEMDTGGSGDFKH